MSKFLEPAKDVVLVIDVPTETIIDGISLPDNIRQQEMVYGTVVASGPLAASTFPKDQVCYGPYAGKSVVIDGIQFRLLKEGQIEAYVREKAETGVV